MTNSSILSPLLGQFRADANVDFCHSSARSLPCVPSLTSEGEDHRLEDDLHHAFCTAGYAQLRHIGVNNRNGRVELQGRVPTYFLKQVAHSVAASLPGIQHVVNNIEVACPR